VRGGDDVKIDAVATRDKPGSTGAGLKRKTCASLPAEAGATT